jgi:hypothetical protein
MYKNYRSITIYLVVVLVVYFYGSHFVSSGTDSIGLSPADTTCR